VKGRTRDHLEDPYKPKEFESRARLILEKFIKILGSEGKLP